MVTFEGIMNTISLYLMKIQDLNEKIVSFHDFGNEENKFKKIVRNIEHEISSYFLCVESLKEVLYKLFDKNDQTEIESSPDPDTSSGDLKGNSLEHSDESARKELTFEKIEIPTIVTESEKSSGFINTNEKNDEGVYSQENVNSQIGIEEAVIIQNDDVQTDQMDESPPQQQLGLNDFEENEMWDLLDSIKFPQNAMETTNMKLVKPGTSQAFRNKLIMLLISELQKIFKIHGGSLRSFEWIDLPHEEEEIVNDVLAKVCDLNPKILLDCVTEILENIVSIYKANKPLHEDLNSRCREITDMYFVKKVNHDEKKMYLAYLQILNHSYDKMLFVPKFEEFVAIIIKEMTNSLFYEEPFNADFPSCLNRYKTHKVGISFEQAVNLLGLDPSRANNTNCTHAVNKMMYFESKNFDLTSMNFYEEEIEIFNEVCSKLYDY